MRITRCFLVSFSPCGGTLASLRAIGSGLGAAAEEIDLTLPASRLSKHAFGPEDLVVLGFPVYGGRLPYPAEDAFATLSGEATPAVLAAVYGNRAYEDALMEMNRLATARGFAPVAAVAAVAEHVMVPQVAAARPDAADKSRLAAFGAAVARYVAELACPAEADLAVPGQYPYEKKVMRPGISPLAGESCVRCGQCAAVCPTGAIAPAAPETTRPELCMMCMACVRTCPVTARVLDYPGYAALAERLTTHFSVRREPEFFPAALA